MRSPSTKAETRRQEAKRQHSKQRMRLWRVISQSIHPSALLIWVGFYVLCLLILLTGGESMPWQLGQRVNRNITSRVDFEMEDRKATESQHRMARETAPNVYLANTVPIQTITAELTHLLELAKEGKADAFKTQATAKGWTFKEPQAVLNTLTAEYVTDKQGSEKYNKLITAVTNRLTGEYIVGHTIDESIRKASPQTSILRRPGQPDITVLTNQLRLITEPKVVEAAARQAVDNPLVPAPLREPLAQVVIRALAKPNGNAPVYAPLWGYSREATTKLMDAEEQKVARVVITFKRGDTLVGAESSDIIGGQEMELLRQEHQKYLELQKVDPYLARARLLTQLGMVTLMSVLTVGLIVYSVSYQGRILQKPTRSLALAGLALLMIGLSRFFDYPFINLPAEFSVGLVVMAAAFLTIAYNQRFAFGICGVLAAMVTLCSGGGFGLFLTHITALGIAVFTLREVRTRSKMIAVGAWAALGAFVVSLAAGLIEGEELKFVFTHALAAAGSALFAGFIVQGLLPTFERIFNIATSMTLLEWCDASRPLLRRLAQEAPGTYSHSLVLSQLAEEAAGTIGARGLLGRVGALYHDVGKVQKPAYFVENQEARMNLHDHLSPTMSLLVIFGHVKDGIELARAYGLPRMLHQFILEHHGTTVVKYFLHAASEAAARNHKTRGKHDREVRESEFRYPGPKPGSKESAILMLSDGCEGAARALSEPTPGRIESTVHQVVMDRLNDGQFDDCDITMRELKLVELSLVKSLCSIHHGRIKYPKDPPEKIPPPLKGPPSVEAEAPPAADAPSPAEVVP